MKISVKNETMVESKKTHLAHFPYWQRGARSDQSIQLWWSIRMNLQGLGYQQSQMTVMYRCQWTMNSVRHFRVRNLMVNLLEKVSGIILLIICANFSLKMSFNFLFNIIYFTRMLMLWTNLMFMVVQIQSSY